MATFGPRANGPFVSRTRPTRPSAQSKSLVIRSHRGAPNRLDQLGPYLPPLRIIYKQTGNLRAVQILLGHTKIESTVRYLGVDIEDALANSEATEI